MAKPTLITRRQDPRVPIGSVWMPPVSRRYYTSVRGSKHLTLGDFKFPKCAAVVLSRMWRDNAWVLTLLVHSEIVVEWELDVSYWRRLG